MEKFTYQNRTFTVDQYACVYEILEKENVFYCKLNRRSLRDAVIQAMSVEDDFDYQAADEYKKETA